MNTQPLVIGGAEMSVERMEAALREVGNDRNRIILIDSLPADILGSRDLAAVGRLVNAQSRIPSEPNIGIPIVFDEVHEMDDATPPRNRHERRARAAKRRKNRNARTSQGGR